MNVTCRAVCFREGAAGLRPSGSDLLFEGLLYMVLPV